MRKTASLVYALAALLALAVSPSLARAAVQDRLFDFTDEFYRQNGVDPAAIVNRRQADGRRGIADTPYFFYQREVRTLQLNPAYDQSGAIRFWTVMGDLFVSSFTKDEAGTRARQIADNMPLYVFPTRTGNPIGLGNNRQADIVDTRNGYFSNNPLGLWIHIWVSYTDAAFNTSEGKKTLADLQKRNGAALDGTPIIRTLSELENLFSKGFAAKRFRNPDGSEGPMYGVCPVVKDPRGGGIANDQTLAYVRKPDGSPLEPYFPANFDALKLTGDWAK